VSVDQYTEVTDCVFWNNEALLGGVSGGALQIGSSVVTGNTFYENSGGHALVGGTVNFHSGTSTMLNNILAGTVKGAAIELTSGATVTGGCNVFWDNPDGDALGYTLAPTDRSVNPLFCYPDTGNFDLAENSPCLPAYSEGCDQIGARGEGCGPISVEGQSWGSIKAQYRE
jgi:hypothetical protein